MQKYVRNLHESGRRAVFIVDPGMSVKAGYPPYDEGIEEGLFIKDLEGKPYIGGYEESFCP